MKIKKVVALLGVLGLLLIICFACGIRQVDKAQTKQDTLSIENTNSESTEKTDASNTEEHQKPQDNGDSEPEKPSANQSKNDDETTPPATIGASEAEPTATEPPSTEPPTTYSPETKPAETDPPQQNQHPQKPTNPPVTEPPATDSEKTYNTAWGTRPYEFEEMGRRCFDDYFGFYMHWDRYGNVWWDHSDTITRPNKVYSSSLQMAWGTAYFGNGRWSGSNHYWSEDGESGGYGVWAFGGGIYVPSNWGSDYVVSYPQGPSDVVVWNTLSYYMEYLITCQNAPEYVKEAQEFFGFSDEVCDMIINNPTAVPIP